MKRDYTPTQVAVLASCGLIGLAALVLVLATVGGLIAAFAGWTPADTSEEVRLLLLGLGGAVVTIATATVGVKIAQGDSGESDAARRRRKHVEDFGPDDDDPDAEPDELGDDIGEPNLSGTPPQQWKAG